MLVAKAQLIHSSLSTQVGCHQSQVSTSFDIVVPPFTEKEDVRQVSHSIYTPFSYGLFYSICTYKLYVFRIKQAPFQLTSETINCLLFIQVIK